MGKAKKVQKSDGDSDSSQTSKRPVFNAADEEKAKLFKKYAVWVAVFLAVFFLGYMKMKEETFRRMNMSAGKDVIQENLYEVMNVSYSASHDDVKKKYKELASSLHPDKNPECEDCKEKFEKLAKAYEILGNEESRKFYDTTSNAMNTIKSSTISLNMQSYRQMVEYSNDIWMIMIYIDDSTCETFTNFWDETAKQFPFIKFGRVNATFQADLLPLLPFRAEEFPFVYSQVPGKIPEFLEFNLEKPSPYELRKFVQNSLDKKYTEIEYGDMVKHLRAEKSSTPSVTAVVRTRVSTAFTYLSYKTSDYINFYNTKLSDHSKVIKFLGVNNANYIIKFPEHLEYAGKPYITMDFERNEAAHMAINTLTKFLAIPQMQRYGYLDFCGTSEMSSNKDHFADHDLPTVCVMALKDKTKDFHMPLISYFKQKQTELISKYVVAARKQESAVFDRLKNVQFATVQLEDNKLFSEFIAKTGVNNPKAMIYITGEQKFVVLNNLGDLEDTFEDIMEGSATNMKDFVEATGSETPLSLYFTPDDMTLFNLMFKHVSSCFDGFKMFVMYGTTMFLLAKYAHVDFKQSGALIGVLALLYSVAMTWSEGSRNGIF